MKNILAVLQKELKTYFVSPIAYVVLTVFFVISGYFFYSIVSIFVERSMMMMMQSQQFGGRRLPWTFHHWLAGIFFKS